jgi:hypothetical protein
MQLELASLAHWERGSLPQINMVWCHLSGEALPVGWGHGTGVKELKTAPYQSWTNPQKCCRRAQTETEGAPKLLGSKFIKQVGSDSADLSPKAEPQEQRGLSLYTI